MNPSLPIRPSLWYCLLSVPFFLVGTGVFLYALITGLTGLTDSLTQVVVPGEAELALQSGRTYTVFLEQESVVDGEIYSTTEPVAGLGCRLTSIPGGGELGVRRAGANTTYSVGGRSGKSVLEFSVPADGAYGFSCDYGGRAGRSPWWRSAPVSAAVSSGPYS